MTDRDASDAFIERYFGRKRELEETGLGKIEAGEIASLELKIEQWPESWGDDLKVLIYGDFAPPEGDVDLPALGITVHSEKLKSTSMRSAITVLRATVTIEEKSLDALIDASRRLDLLLGTWSLVRWGNSAVGWRLPWLIDQGGGADGSPFDRSIDDVQTVLARLSEYPPDTQRKLRAALYWVQRARPLMLESERTDVLDTFVAYWTAFESLVEAVCSLRPPESLSRQEKQEHIDDRLNERRNRLSLGDIEELYRSVMNPGFVGRASHALAVCFGDAARGYIDECFHISLAKDRLYDIRNAISHGEADPQDLTELYRIEDKLQRLWMIVWGMFGRLLPFKAPVDPAARAQASPA